jgi:hypothetical protein
MSRNREQKIDEMSPIGKSASINNAIPGISSNASQPTDTLKKTITIGIITILCNSTTRFRTITLNKWTVKGIFICNIIPSEEMKHNDNSMIVLDIKVQRTKPTARCGKNVSIGDLKSAPKIVPIAPIIITMLIDNQKAPILERR